MKRGILFFYNMGTITTIARIAIIPLGWTLTRFAPPAFFFSLFLLGVSLLVAMIPAPSDKAMIRVIERYREEALRQMSEESMIRDKERFIVTKICFYICPDKLFFHWFDYRIYW